MFFCFSDFIELIKVFLINVTAILIISTKLASPGALQSLYSEKKLCHSFCPWCHEQGFNLWLKLYCRCVHVTRVSIEEVIILQFYKDLTRKTDFFEGWPWFKFINLDYSYHVTFTFYSESTLVVAWLWKNSFFETGVISEV